MVMVSVSFQSVSPPPRATAANAHSAPAVSAAITRLIIVFRLFLSRFTVRSSTPAAMGMRTGSSNTIVSSISWYISFSLL